MSVYNPLPLFNIGGHGRSMQSIFATHHYILRLRAGCSRAFERACEFLVANDGSAA